ncbi:MAG: hypothetical protein NZ108_00560 [Bacteroidia bacterium]|nr:hypothetical protein [Bacteroidia bacterium]
MNPTVLILAQPSIRLHYVCHWLFKEQLNLSFSIQFNPSSIETNSWVCSYAKEPNFSANYSLKPDSILYETGIPTKTIQQWLSESFETRDLFGFLFFLLAGTPWYQTNAVDDFGRIDESQIDGLNSLENPLADEIVSLFRKEIQLSFPDWKPPTLHVSTEWTFDFDSPWKYKQKPIWIQFGSIIKQILHFDWTGLEERFLLKDPFETDSHLPLFQESGTVRVFVLHGTGLLHDSQFPFSLPAWRKRIRTLAQIYPVGLHPSFRSSEEPERLWQEKQWLEQILEQPVIASRQHFLKVKLPETMRELALCGIKEDYSAACYSIAGYKHGTSRSFLWFDLLRNEISTLRIFPSSWMDRTMLRYLKYSPEKAIQNLRLQYQQLQQYGGTQRIILHNDTLSDVGEWKGWKKVLLAESHSRKSCKGIPE